MYIVIMVRQYNWAYKRITLQWYKIQILHIWQHEQIWLNFAAMLRTQNQSFVQFDF